MIRYNFLRKFLIAIFALLCTLSSAQEQEWSSISLEQIKDSIDKNKRNPDVINPFLFAYIAKAKESQHSATLMHAYRKMIFLGHDINTIPYADSLLQLSQKTKQNKTIGIAYQALSTAYYAQKDYRNSLKNSLIAEQYIQKTEDKYTLYKIRNAIGRIKFHIGEYQEALEIYEESAAYYANFKDTSSVLGYLNSLLYLSRCHHRLGNYAECHEYSILGLKKIQQIEPHATQKMMRSFFLQTEGINQYTIRNYDKAIPMLKESAENFIAQDDLLNEHISYLYLGKVYWDQGDKEAAIPYFERVDQLFTQKQISDLELRCAYTYLISYHEEHKDLEEQLEYTNTLIKVDSLLSTSYKDISRVLYKEFDTKMLLDSKEQLEKQIESSERRSKLLYVLLTIIILLISWFTYSYYKKQKKYRERYQRLLNELKQPEKTKSIESPDIELNDVVLKGILKNLEIFEQQSLFLKSNISQTSLAEEWNTNTSYLSRVINSYKGRNFKQYLNDLRIDYCLEKLKENPTFRSYKVSSIAEELGFGSARSFSQAFEQRTGLKPSYFINQLNEDCKNKTRE